MLFKRKNEISLNRVHDTVVFRESDETLKLQVYSDPMRLTSGLMHVQREMQGLSDESPEEEQTKMANELATVIFGAEQAAQLMAFYHNDAPGVLNVCLQYFKQRLTRLIVQAQKKNSVKK